MPRTNYEKLPQTMTKEEIAAHNKSVIDPYMKTQDLVINGYIPATVTPFLREMVFRRDKYRCSDCGIDGLENLEVLFDVHHLVSPKRGGINHLNNLITLCKKCHVNRHSNRE